MCVCVNMRCWSMGQTLTSDTLWRKSVRRAGCENIWPRSKLNIGNAPLIYGRLGWAKAMPLSSSQFVCVYGCRVLSDGRMIRLFFAIQLHQYELLMHVPTGLTFNCVTCHSEKTNSKPPAVITAHFSCCAIKFSIKNRYCANCVHREVWTLGREEDFLIATMHGPAVPVERQLALFQSLPWCTTMFLQ